MNGTGVPDVSAATSRTSSPASAGSASRTDRMAPMTSHTSGPPVSLALRPAGPSLNVMSGSPAIRSASSTSLLVALDRVRSRCAATNAESRSNTRGSNRTDDGPGVTTMYDNVGERNRLCKRLACYPGTGVEPGSVVSRGGSAARGDQEPSVPRQTAARPQLLRLNSYTAGRQCGRPRIRVPRELTIARFEAVIGLKTPFRNGWRDRGGAPRRPHDAPRPEGNEFCVKPGLVG